VIVVGVTGSFASGKSAATTLFKKQGAVVFDADVSARGALEKGKPAYRAVVKLFGGKILGKNGQIDRAALAKRVFSNPKELKTLGILVHPAVIMDALEIMDRTKKKKGILVLDVPLLFESKMDNLADFTVLVKAPAKATLARASQRGVDAALAKKILAAQWPPEKKAKLADYVIENASTLADLEKKVKETAAKIREAAASLG